MRKIAKLFENPSVYLMTLIIVIFLSFSYWTYLYFTSEMGIHFDAVDYELSGRTVFEKGWLSYFIDGPQREPFFIFTIAFSMKMEEVFSLNYQYFQKLIQVMLLFSTQLLLLYILDKLRVHNFIKILTVLYFGFSPAIVNAAFSLYSEIIAFPFVLLSVILLGESWRRIYERNARHCFNIALVTASVLLLLILGKGVFWPVTIFSLLPFLSIWLRSLWMRKWDVCKNAAIFMLTVILVVNGGIFVVKLMNRKYNGYFTYTGGKYNYLFMGSAIKRARPLTKEIILSHIASIPGTGVCEKIFSKEMCRYTEWFGSVDMTVIERNIFLEAYPDEKKHKAMVEIAVVKIMEHPFQFSFFFVVELFKLFFWESTRIGFVLYPDWLERLFNNTLLRYGIRLVIATLTILGFSYLVHFCYRQRHKLYDAAKNYERERYAFLMFMFMAGFIGIYAACYVLTRYSLPIASLFLLSIALMSDSLLKPQSR